MAEEVRQTNPMEAPQSLKTLTTLAIGEGGTVFDVPDIRLLASLGIRIGKYVTLMSKSVARGPYIVKVNHRSIVIDRDVASHIFIKQ